MSRRGSLHLRRYREIAQILVRHGLGSLINVFGLERFVPFRRTVSMPAGTITQPERVRLALEDLGPTFIKLGQILSTRTDLVSPPLQHELAKLQDATPPTPYEQIEAIIVDELGMPPSEAFAEFDPEPLASASIGQAHCAIRHDGTKVVVKVRKPGVVERIDEDLDILFTLAQTAARRWDVATRYDLEGLVQEFSDTLRGEIDYLHEARNAERFRETFADDEFVRVPRVYRDTTTARVITLERLTGIKVSNIERLREADVDTRNVAEHIFRMYLKMIFDFGHFHADPHAGNFFIDRHGRIGLIDFGMVGHVDERMRDELVLLILAISAEDAERVVDVLLDLGVARSRIDRTLLRQDLQRILHRYTDRALGEVSIGDAIEDSMAVIRRHGLQLPSNLALLMKTAIMAEGLSASVNPEFEPILVLRPYARQLLLRQFSPEVVGRRLGRVGYEAIQLGSDLPPMLRRILGSVDRGQLEVGVRPERFEPLMHRAERLVNRIVLGILAAAFIIALSTLMTIYNPPGWERWAGVAFGLGFLVAGALGIYLAWTIMRSTR